MCDYVNVLGKASLVEAEELLPLGARLWNVVVQLWKEAANSRCSYSFSVTVNVELLAKAVARAPSEYVATCSSLHLHVLPVRVL